MKMRPGPMAELRRMLANDKDACELNNQSLLLLDTLAGHGQPLSLAAAAELIDLSHAATSRLAKRLVELGLIERAVSPHDARRQTLAPSDKGQAVYARVRGYMAATMAPKPQLATTEDLS